MKNLKNNKFKNRKRDKNKLQSLEYFLTNKNKNF